MGVRRRKFAAGCRSGGGVRAGSPCGVRAESPCGAGRGPAVEPTWVERERYHSGATSPGQGHTGRQGLAHAPSNPGTNLARAILGC